LTQLDGIAPESNELGVMLPYTPLHHLLFAAGAPDVLVMTSAGRAGEPMPHNDEDAIRVLTGIADAFLLGDRPIARRIDDSLVRVSYGVTTILQRSRGLVPGVLAHLSAKGPILALGCDRENAIALLVDGQVIGSQHIGDVEPPAVRSAFRRTIEDLCRMYGVQTDARTIVHDLHPGYYTTELATTLPSARRIAVQHHRAHVAGVIAEREAWSTSVLAFAFDGAGYGDDGTIWGGEIFTGGLGDLRRTGHMRAARLPAGAERFPARAAAGFLSGFDRGVFLEAPFNFPAGFTESCGQGFETTSMGRLFDTVAALLGFVREQSFVAQAGMWLEHLAWQSAAVDGYAFAVSDELDYRPVLERVVEDRIAGRDVAEIAHAFH
ncbi:MAG: Sua5/YciO/YrdC/YwlC family protein, partial [Vulcanimicrobiaceae bacterium]